MADTKLMAIVNVTPDSFSDGGAHFHVEDALKAIDLFIAEGASIIDLGAESTRPGATPITAEEEWQRLAPIMQQLSQFTPSIQFSIDTRHSETARKSLAMGAHWINDVSGLSSPAMIEAAASSGCPLVLMHSLSVPADKQIVLHESVNVVRELIAWAMTRIAQLEQAGIDRSRIIFDPGLGFGKTAIQSMEILRGIEDFGVLGVPLLIGHSRKSFLTEINKDRDTATLAVSQSLAKRSVEYLRVHDIAAHKKMLDRIGAKHDGCC